MPHACKKPHGCKQPGLVQAKVRSYIQVYQVGGRSPSPAVPVALVRCNIGSEVPGIQTGTHRGCWFHRWSLSHLGTMHAPQITTFENKNVN